MTERKEGSGNFNKRKSLARIKPEEEKRKKTGSSSKRKIVKKIDTRSPTYFPLFDSLDSY